MQSTKPKPDRKHVEVIVKMSDALAKSLPPSPKKDVMVESIVDLIIDENLPLDIGESDKFCGFLRRLGSKFKPICQEAVCSAISNRCAAITSDLTRRLAAVPSVNITVNTWTDSARTIFIMITAHFLEDHTDGLELSSVLLSCQRLLGKTNAKQVVTAFAKVLDYFHITRKIDYITVPNMEGMKISHSLSFVVLENAMTNCTLENGVYFDDDNIWCPLSERTMGALQVEVHECVRFSQLSCFSHTLSRCIDDVIRKTERK